MGLGVFSGALLTAASTFAARSIGMWASKKMEERKWAKAYRLAESKPEGAVAAPLAPAPPPPPTQQEQLELEVQRTRVKQVLLGVELTEAQDAVHRIRELLDAARTETADRTAKYVVER